MMNGQNSAINKLTNVMMSKYIKIYVGYNLVNNSYWKVCAVFLPKGWDIY
jgi:hypothetical protein